MKWILEDKEYMAQLLCREGEDFSKYECLFDDTDTDIKRAEFNGIKKSRLEQLKSRWEGKCRLEYSPECQEVGVEIDHVIPLSTNKLNKRIRGIKAEKDKKVITQSLGSNHIYNMVLTCSKCNGAKKHQILEKEKLREILDRTFQNI